MRSVLPESIASRPFIAAPEEMYTEFVVKGASTVTNTMVIHFGGISVHDYRICVIKNGKKSILSCQEKLDTQ